MPTSLPKIEGPLTTLHVKFLFLQQAAEERTRKKGEVVDECAPKCEVR